MPGPVVTAYAVPTGGVITLAISGAVSGMATLSRAASGSPFSQIYSGLALQNYIDIGDGLPAPLAPGTAYQYQYVDNLGTTTTPFIQPINVITAQVEPITQIFIRVIQGALNSMILPPGIRPAQATQAMPLGGQIPFPLVVLNLDLFQQSNMPIGQSVPFAAVLAALSGVPASGYAVVGMAKRLYRVSVLTNNAIERDFYRDYLISIFEAVYQDILQPLGIDVTHRWQASSGQVANERQEKMPGFYFADIMMEFEGNLNILLNLSYPLIETITVTSSGTTQGASGYVSDIAQAPHD